ncbi:MULTISPECIES: DUF565 domain-containing protein [unclassified Synechococcus]|uniref:DUF565 domain-containing protein n=2 Tax=Synechococcus TaxID=1129 RepID=UPI0028801AA1|nr:MULTISPECIES: DUF565 domain-containing protein [unclassified Synechococcus]
MIDPSSFPFTTPSVPSMSRQPFQATRFQLLLERLNHLVLDWLRGNWRERSLAWLALLVGLFAGNNLTTYVLFRLGLRPLVVLAMVVLVELLVRLRSHWVKGKPSLGWVLCDNARIGLVYAVVLEGFKLGS